MSEFTKRIIKPVSLPIIALGAIAILVFAGSRILLAVPEAWSVGIALAIAATVLFYASILSNVREVQPVQRGMALVLGLAIVGAGGWGLGTGVREIEGHAVGIPLVAKGLAWEQTSLTVPAGEPFQVELTNNDAGVPHNIGIYADSSFATPIFNSTEFNGVATEVVEVEEPLAAGTYAFRCDFHPTTMTGTMTASEDAGAEHGGASGGTGAGHDTDGGEVPAPSEPTDTATHGGSGDEH